MEMARARSIPGPLTRPQPEAPPVTRNPPNPTHLEAISPHLADNLNASIQAPPIAPQIPLHPTCIIMTLIYRSPWQPNIKFENFAAISVTSPGLWIWSIVSGGYLIELSQTSVYGWELLFHLSGVRQPGMTSQG